MQEGGALHANVHERRLHAGQYACHLALVDVADDAAVPRAFDMHLLQHAVFDDGDTGLLRRYVYEDFFAHVETSATRRRPARRPRAAKHNAFAILRCPRRML